MLRDAIRRFFASRNLEPERILVACSGGVDSTALLVALREEGIDLVCGHVNHHLRGAESDGDEAFVCELCARLGVPLQVADGTLTADAVKHRGIEAAAREARFARLQEVRQATGARWIATAHQKNDQAETVLMRLFTGSGLAGLRGIHPLREDGVIRPLLEVTRAETEDFLRERGIEARIDRSNADPRFLRNRIRATLAEYGPSVVENLAALATEVPEGNLAEALLQQIRKLDPNARVHLRRIATELRRSPRVTLSKSLELVLRRRPEPTPRFELDLTPDHPARIPELGITVHVRPVTRHPTPDTRQLIQLPENARPHFTVRNRRPGDRFQPLGMNHEKKLKDLLIDRKIAVELRARIPLILWNDTIAWVAGVEVSEKFKVTDGASRLFEVSIEEDQDPKGLQR